ncbi:helix-turn-helix domain-containing protein [Arsenicibacter rosenii]|uniref:HTH cro/C1-type domain-containing protein n=1 Tax=Arsenicibacter rosenii TaxID=1750698 RepID=A0A1S2VNI7_9BACT|nr:helix-turn-helix transcriptional regulator [Arsenicibacter rosenii]OIN60341.1 hypothetical protein BLX24_05810 [Arsenicibacter rosenii]
MLQPQHNIGNKIRKIRELRNFTQTYMAERLGIKQSTYSTIENGELDVTLSRLQEISKLLEVRIEDIISFDEKMVFNISNSQNGVGYINNNVVNQNQKLEEFFREMAVLRERIGFLEGVISKKEGH